LLWCWGLQIAAQAEGFVGLFIHLKVGGRRNCSAFLLYG
jgi:hypothetical protein